jgi:hypothetical protein
VLVAKGIGRELASEETARVHLSMFEADGLTPL